MKTWGLVKDSVNALKEPNPQATLAALITDEGTHEAGKEIHILRKHDLMIEEMPGAYEISFKYAICPICQEVRWKKFQAINHRDGLSYERVLWRKGRPVEEQDYEAERIRRNLS